MMKLGVIAYKTFIILGSAALIAFTHFLSQNFIQVWRKDKKSAATLLEKMGAYFLCVFVGVFFTYAISWSYSPNDSAVPYVWALVIASMIGIGVAYSNDKKLTDKQRKEIRMELDRHTEGSEW